MDFTKFVSLLDKQALFFSRSDKLGDSFEGSFSKANIQMRPTWYGDTTSKLLKQLPNIFENFRYHTYLNCWHMNDIESDAMWKIYLEGEKGIAVQSTFKNLVNSFREESMAIYCGIVKYINYDSEIIPENNTFWPYVHKRKSFAHENELRAVLQYYPNKEKNISLDTPGPLGISVLVDLETLIEKIFIAPTSPSWLDELVTSICSKYEITKDVVTSRLKDRPVF